MFEGTPLAPFAPPHLERHTWDVSLRPGLPPSPVVATALGPAAGNEAAAGFGVNTALESLASLGSATALESLASLGSATALESLTSLPCLPCFAGWWLLSRLNERPVESRLQDPGLLIQTVA